MKIPQNIPEEAVFIGLSSLKSQEGHGPLPEIFQEFFHSVGKADRGFQVFGLRLKIF